MGLGPEHSSHCLPGDMFAFHAVKLFCYDGTAAGKQQLFIIFTQMSLRHVGGDQ